MMYMLWMGFGMLNANLFGKPLMCIIMECVRHGWFGTFLIPREVIQGLSKSLHHATTNAFPCITASNALIHGRATENCWYDEECGETRRWEALTRKRIIPMQVDSPPRHLKRVTLDQAMAMSCANSPKPFQLSTYHPCHWQIKAIVPWHQRRFPCFRDLSILYQPMLEFFEDKFLDG